MGALALLALALPLRAAERTLVSLDGFLMKAGHEPRWSSAGFDDRGWQRVNLDAVPTMGDSVWLRKARRTPRR